MQFDHIRLLHPPFLRIKEVYNVPEGKWHSGGEETIVEQVKIDGYLGMVFKTSRTQETMEHAELHFMFCGKDGSPVGQVSKKLSLFRPKLVIGEASKDILVKSPSRFVKGRIPAQNVGYGTVFLQFRTTSSSETQLRVPKEIQDFRQVFEENLQAEMKLVKNEFAHNAELIDGFMEYLRTGLERATTEKIEEMKEFLNTLRNRFDSEPQFMEAFFEAFSNATLKNIHLIGIVERVADYINSIQGRRIILLNATDVLDLSTEPKRLEIELLSFDIMFEPLETFRLGPLSITGTDQLEVPIHRLFEWRQAE